MLGTGGEDAVGAAFAQEGCSVAPEPRNLSARESVAPVYDLELFGIVHDLRKWLTVLGSKKIIVETDHATPRHLPSQKKLSPQVRKWPDKLAEFNLEITHKPGPTSVVADGFSRRQDHVIGGQTRAARGEPMHWSNG